MENQKSDPIPLKNEILYPLALHQINFDSDALVLHFIKCI